MESVTIVTQAACAIYVARREARIVRRKLGIDRCQLGGLARRPNIVVLPKC